MSTSGDQGGYRPDIEGLRAFAVTAVIINHFNRQLLPGGYLGVDLFFVISGYVITSSLSARKSQTLAEWAASASGLLPDAVPVLGNGSRLPGVPADAQDTRQTSLEQPPA
ncbi:MAG: acyltransferase, partial [Cyanobium sp.]|nr:acyltransferase [Cyanobium sp.]